MELISQEAIHYNGESTTKTQTA